MVAVLTMGCASEPPVNCHCAPPLRPIAEIEGAWSYTTTRVEEQDGVWVDVETSPPTRVEAIVDENWVVFRDVETGRPAQAFRIVGRGTIEDEVRSGCCGERHVETYDGRPWQVHNGVGFDWSTALVIPPLVASLGEEATPVALSSDLSAMRIAEMSVARMSIPTVYAVRVCLGADPMCSRDALVEHTFTRAD